MSINLREIKRIAIIGATTNPQKFGNIVLKDLKRKVLMFCRLVRNTILSKGSEHTKVLMNYQMMLI